MDQPWQIELLGWLRLVQTDRVVSRFRSRRAEALLAYLAYHTDRSHPREQLIELLWPNCDLAAGQQRLRVELASLRRQLEPPGVPPGAVLVATRTTVRLNLEACVTDAARFEAALEAAKRPASRTKRAERLTTAVRLYRGELLPGFYDEWILPERQRLAEAFQQSLRELVGLLEELGDLSGAVQWARRAVAADPLEEENHHRLIRLLLESGQVEAARHQYEQGQRQLLQELGAGLSPEIRSLIMDATPGKDRPPIAPAGSQGKRGRSRERPDRQPAPPSPADIAGMDAASGSDLPLNGSGAAIRPSGNLPLRFTRFFGREQEIEQLQRLLQEPKTKLVTMTGHGGSGKTRLAQQVAEGLREAFPDGVWFVSLRELSDPTLIPDQILLALRLPRSPQLQPLEQVVQFLSRAPALLILDNYEHLVETGVETTQQLLEQVERLTVLVTSRQRLGLEGEREFPVAPLPVPEFPAPARARDRARRSEKTEQEHEQEQEQDLPTALLLYPSVVLFVDRAQVARPDFQVTAHNAAAVAALCQRLEGLPLAIELAAARAGVLTPQQMLLRLEQRFELLVGRQRPTDPRHRSLRAALDWSYQLLTPELQQFFARLSIFRGGWTVAAASSVCDEPRALEYLEYLRECSLVQATEAVGEIRFHLLETLREYGAEQLDEDERQALARRHAECFMGLAETAEPELTRADQLLWLDRLEREHDNLRAALAWSIESGEVELGLRLGSALEGFWQVRGYQREGRDQLRLLLAQPESAVPTATRARGLSTAGALTSFHGELETARALYEESLAIWRRLEDRTGIATVLRHLGWMAWSQYDWPTARARGEESLALCRELGDMAGIAKAAPLLAEVCRGEGDAAAARALVEEVLALARARGDRQGIMAGLEQLGCAAMEQRDLATARLALEESLAVARELGHRRGIAQALTSLGYVAMWQGDYPAARDLFEQCLPLWRALGHHQELLSTLGCMGETLRQLGEAEAGYALLEEQLALVREGNWSNHVPGALMQLGFCAGDLGRWEEAAACYAESLRLRESDPNEESHIAFCLTGLARVALARGRPARAARLLGAAEPLWARASSGGHPVREQAAAAVRAEMEPAGFEAAWAEGRAMPPEQAIALALQEVSAA